MTRTESIPNPDVQGEPRPEIAGFGVRSCYPPSSVERVARLEIDATRRAVRIVGGTTSEFGWRALYLHATACDRATEPNGGREG